MKLSGMRDMDLKNLFFLVIWMGCTIGLTAQDYVFEDFFENLEEVEKREEIISLMDEIEKIERMYFEDVNKVDFKIEANRSWQFLFAKRMGWEEIVGQKATDLLAYYRPSFYTSLQGREIDQMFELQGKPKAFNPVKIVHFSNKRYYTPFVMQAKHYPYAVVVVVHSYPNGNMTSWFKETRYYFKKE